MVIIALLLISALSDMVDEPQRYSCKEAPLPPQVIKVLGQRASTEVFRGTFGAKAAETRRIGRARQGRERK
jgi:hypothetical protein